MKCRNYIYSWDLTSYPAVASPDASENPQLHLLLYGTSAQQATQDYALAASFLRIITTPAIPRLRYNQEDDSGANNIEEGSGTGWKVMLSMKPRR